MWNAYGLTVLGDKKQKTLRLLKLGNVITFQMSISQYIFQALRRKKQTRGMQPWDLRNEFIIGKSKTCWTHMKKCIANNRLRPTKHKYILFGLSFLKIPLKETENRLRKAVIVRRLKKLRQKKLTQAKQIETKLIETKLRQAKLR